MNSSTSNSNGPTEAQAPTKGRTLTKARPFTGRRLLTTLLWLTVFLFLFDRGLYYLLTRLEAGFYQGSEFEKQFETYVQGKEYSTLILGTSRTYEGIHPLYFEKLLGKTAYKESYVGKGPMYNHHFYRLYKKYAGIPRVVVYGVDYFIYAVETDPKWMARFDIRPETGEDWLLSAPMLLVKHKKQVDNFFNTVLIRWQEKRPEGSEVLRDFILMHEYTGMEKKDKKLVLRPGAKYERQAFPTPPGQEGEYFEKLLAQLSNDGVTVILVALPDYFGSYKTNFQRLKFLRNLRKFQSRYKNIHVLNYNRREKFELENADYFNDGGFGQTNSHLSRLGAKAFNQRLMEDIREYYRAE